MKKRISIFMMLAMCISMFSGCSMGINTDYNININNQGALDVSMMIYMSEADYIKSAVAEGLLKSNYTQADVTSLLQNEGLTEFTRDGVVYVASSNQTNDKLKSEYSSIKSFYFDSVKTTGIGYFSTNKNESDYTDISETSFFISDEDNNSFADEKKSSQNKGINAVVKTLKAAGSDKYNTLDTLNDGIFNLSITFAYPIAVVSSGGTISADRKTVTFSLKTPSDSIYAYCENDFKVDGLDNGIMYKKAVSYVIPSDVTEATLNGETVTDYNVTSSKSGKYDLVLKKADGTQKSYEYMVDGKKPVIKGIKNGKTYHGKVKFTVKDDISLDSIKINGKDDTKYWSSDKVKIINKKSHTVIKILKSGKYKIKAKDYVGNTKVAQIKVKL